MAFRKGTLRTAAGRTPPPAPAPSGRLQRGPGFPTALQPVLRDPRLSSTQQLPRVARRGEAGGTVPNIIHKKS